MKVKILFDFIGNVQGKSVRFKADEIAEINKEDADHFVRGGYAQYIKTVRKPTRAKQAARKRS